jgi:hypothetical protein
MLTVEEYIEKYKAKDHVLYDAKKDVFFDSFDHWEEMVINNSIDAPSTREWAKELYVVLTLKDGCDLDLDTCTQADIASVCESVTTADSLKIAKEIWIEESLNEREEVRW